MKPLHGLVAATFTPMHDDGSLWLDRIAPVVDLLVARGVRGLYVCGSTGEGPLLSTPERQAVASAYVQAAAGRIPVVVQVGHSSLEEARGLARHAAEIGADAISATPSTYFRPPDLDAVLDGIELVAAGAPELPFFYYHIPSITGVSIAMEALVEGAQRRMDTFAGVKFSSPNVHEIMNLDLSSTRVLFGFDEMLIAGLAVGVHGAVGSTYNLMPEAYQSVINAFAAGDHAAALAAQRRVTRVVQKLVEHGGIATIKAAMAWTGLAVGPTRSPLRSPTIERLQTIEEELRRVDRDALGLFRTVDQA